MPRGDGKKSGNPRPFRTRGEAPQYVPRKLKRRRKDFEEGKTSFKPSEVDMMRLPGSQNPRKPAP